MISFITKLKSWISENLPVLSVVYQNKYVAMIYDRFASLEPKKQKQIILGILLLTLFIITGYLTSSYISLWRIKNQISKNEKILTMLMKYQKAQRDKSADISGLDKNRQLDQPESLKKYIIQSIQNAKISQRMAQIDEKSDVEPQTGEMKSADIKAKQISIKLEKITLSQLKSFLKIVEFGYYDLIISSLKIMNDEKIRGYMNVELNIIAYLFRTPSL